MAEDLQLLSHDSSELDPAIPEEVSDGVGKVIGSGDGSGGGSNDPNPSVFGLTAKTDVELSPQQLQSMQTRLQELRQRYGELSDEQWRQRLRPYVNSAVLERIDRELLLDDMGQHFSEVLSLYDRSAIVPSGMLDKQEQYLFLARIMELSSASTSSLAMDMCCSSESVRKKTSRIKEFLVLYGLSPAEISERNTRQAGMVEERVAELKSRYRDMEEFEYRLRIQKVTKNTYVSQEMNRGALLQRIERRYPPMVVYTFLGFLLHLDVSPLWADREFPALNVEMRDHAKKIRQWLRTLRKSQQLMPETAQDLVTLLERSWDHAMASHFDTIVKRFHIDMRDRERLYALLQEKRAHHDNADAGQDFLKAMLERHVLDWQHFPIFLSSIWAVCLGAP